MTHRFDYIIIIAGLAKCWRFCLIIANRQSLLLANSSSYTVATCNVILLQKKAVYSVILQFRILIKMLHNINHTVVIVIYTPTVLYITPLVWYVHCL